MGTCFGAIQVHLQLYVIGEFRVELNIVESSKYHLEVNTKENFQKHIQSDSLYTEEMGVMNRCKY